MDDFTSVWLTLWLSSASTLLVLPAAVGLGWLLAKKRWPGKPIVETITALPLVLPPVATGLILLKLLGRRGPVGGWLYERFGVEILFTWKAVVIALAVMSFPLMVRSFRAAFDSVPARLEGIARTLGASEWRVFFTVTLPLARRGLLAGIVLGFARALGEFGATIMVAGMIDGKTNTLALSIYQSVQTGNDGHALKLLAVSVIIAFLALWTVELLNRRRSF